MRILLYGLQSSGASAIALLLAQRPDCVAFVDIWNMFAAPELQTDQNVIAKVVATTAYPLEVHRTRFKPDITAIILRHQVDNFNSLSVKNYANESGLIDEKFRVMERVISNRSGYDTILYHEDLVFTPGSIMGFCDEIGWVLIGMLFPFAALLRRSGLIMTAPYHLWWDG